MGYLSVVRHKATRSTLRGRCSIGPCFMGEEIKIWEASEMTGIMWLLCGT